MHSKVMHSKEIQRKRFFDLKWVVYFRRPVLANVRVLFYLRVKQPWQLRQIYSVVNNLQHQFKN